MHSLKKNEKHTSSLKDQCVLTSVYRMCLFYLPICYFVSMKYSVEDTYSVSGTQCIVCIVPIL